MESFKHVFARIVHDVLERQGVARNGEQIRYFESWTRSTYLYLFRSPEQPEMNL